MDYSSITNYARNCINQYSQEVQYNWAATGGWERWFQGTFAPYLFFSAGIINETEGSPKLRPNVYINQTGQRVDFILYEKDEISFVELKCIPFTASAGNGIIQSYLNGVYEDWKKLYYRSASNLISLVIIPNDISGIGEEIKNKLIVNAVNCGFNYVINTCTNWGDVYMYVCGFNITYNQQMNNNVLNL